MAANTAVGHTARPAAGRLSAGVQITWFCIHTASVMAGMPPRPEGQSAAASPRVWRLLRCARRLLGSGDDQLAGGFASLHHPVRVGDFFKGEHPRGLRLVDARFGLGDDLLERDR